MKKIEYESPQAEIYNVRLEASILSNVRKAETMNEIMGDWEEDI